MARELTKIMNSRPRDDDCQASRDRGVSIPLQRDRLTGRFPGMPKVSEIKDWQRTVNQSAVGNSLPVGHQTPHSGPIDDDPVPC
jgi:hypothetical protein